MGSFNGEALQQPLPLFPEIIGDPYLWGMDGDCWVRRLSRRPPFTGPAAEARFGGPHATGSPTVLVGGEMISLRDLLRQHGAAILGVSGVERFGEVLPIEAKALSVREPLSVQGHASEAHAAELHRSQPLVFRNAVPGHEGGIAIEPTTLLFDFHSPRIIRALGLEYKSVGKLLGSNPLPPGDTETVLRFFMERVFSATPEQIREVCLDVYTQVAGWRDDRRSPEMRWLLKVREFYPEGDVGVLFMFLMNMVHLKPGQAITIPGGTLHCYLGGEVFEPQRVAGGVYRGAFTKKPIDRELFRKCTSFTTSVPADVAFNGNVIETGRRNYTFGNLGFGFEMLTEGCAANLGHELPQILVSLDGVATIRCDGCNPLLTEVAPGESFLIPASLPLQLSVQSGRVGRFWAP